MDRTDRRTWITMAAAAAALPGLSRAQGRTSGTPAAFDYMMVDLGVTHRTSARQALGQLASATQASLAPTDGRLLGVFAPQLGWASSQAALLLGWAGQARGRDTVIGRLADAGGVVHHRLSATARPTSLASPSPGGIFVHRWFVIGHSDLEEFVELSELGWRDFEARFDTQIYGLFTADRTSQELAAGETRLLLLTRYADHGVWEKSRDPSTAAMEAFGRRQRLTRRSWAASTVLTAPSA